MDTIKMMGNILFYLCFKEISVVDNDEVDGEPIVKSRIAINCSCCQSPTKNNNET